MVTKCKIMHSSDSLMSWFQHCLLWQAVICWVMKFACLSNIQQITGNSSLVHWYGRVSKHGLPRDFKLGLYSHGWLELCWQMAMIDLDVGIQTYKGDSA